MSFLSLLELAQHRDWLRDESTRCYLSGRDDDAVINAARFELAKLYCRRPFSR